MLGPSEEWLEGHKDGPFVATYETIGPHHQYLAPEKRYGREEFDEEDTVDRYLNSVRNQDFFLKNLFDQYKRLGLYEDTVFVLYGDHGEAFGEHGRFQHDNVPYEGTLMFGCWNESVCLASLNKTEKYVYHFGDNPDEIFDLSEDPDERRNLAGERPQEAEKRRRELLEWRAEVSSRYGTQAA